MCGSRMTVTAACQPRPRTAQRSINLSLTDVFLLSRFRARLLSPLSKKRGWRAARVTLVNVKLNKVVTASSLLQSVSVVWRFMGTTSERERPEQHPVRPDAPQGCVYLQSTDQRTSSNSHNTSRNNYLVGAQSGSRAFLAVSTESNSRQHCVCECV